MPLPCEFLSQFTYLAYFTLSETEAPMQLWFASMPRLSSELGVEGNNLTFLNYESRGL